LGVRFDEVTMDRGFANATAVVVGGGRGMGLAAARCIAEDGARVAVVSRSRDDLEAAVDDLTDRGSPEALGLTQRQSTILPAYTAAKAMVTSVSKNLSLLLAPDEILVNVISPGSVASESLVNWAGSVGVDGSDPYRLMAAITEHFGHPAHLPRAGLPEEIGPVVAFLASRRNSYMTGADVNVDGGSDFT
jgi:NAD(P)-dependent dehydrogenase (short-subunit alcohol dehydrogenase family)